MTFPELYDDSHPEALARNTRKFSVGWIKTPLMLLKKCRLVTGDRKGDAAFAGGPYAQPHSEYYREIVERRDRLVKDVDVLLRQRLFCMTR